MNAQLKRKGAGKPALYGKPMRRVNVMLDEETIKFYQTWGVNLSAGIRGYWREQQDFEKACDRADATALTYAL